MSRGEDFEEMLLTGGGRPFISRDRGSSWEGWVSDTSVQSKE